MAFPPKAQHPNALAYKSINEKGLINKWHDSRTGRSVCEETEFKTESGLKGFQITASLFSLKPSIYLK